MKLRHIETFRAVVLTGSASGAAQLLNVSQPVVSRVLQHAEQQLGFKLFERVKGRLVPTPEARRLYPDVERIFSDLERLRTTSRNLRLQSIGHLRIAATPSLAQSLLPAAIERMRRAHPGVVFELVTHHTTEMITAILTSSVDLGIVSAPPMAAGIVSAPIAQGNIVLAVPTSWPTLSRKGHATAEALAGRDLIKLHDDTPLGALITDRLEQTALLQDADVLVQTYSLAAALVEHGLGYALLDQFTAASARTDAQRLYRIAPAIEFPVEMLRPAHEPESVLAEALRRHLADVAREHTERTDALCEGREIVLAPGDDEDVAL